MAIKNENSNLLNNVVTSMSSVEIDRLVTASATRAIWESLCAYDPRLKALLHDGIGREIEGLLLQQEISNDDEAAQLGAVVQILSSFRL
jgi:hypothetical protein